MLKLARPLLILTTIGFISACTPTVSTHGNLLRAQEVDALTVGVATQRDVLRELGSPTTKSVMNGDAWYYITSRSQTGALTSNEITDREVYIMSFNEEGTLVDVKRRTNEDGKPLALQEDATPTQGQAMGVIDQILMNLGVN